MTSAVDWESVVWFVVWSGVAIAVLLVIAYVGMGLAVLRESKRISREAFHFQAQRRVDHAEKARQVAVATWTYQRQPTAPAREGTAYDVPR